MDFEAAKQLAEYVLGPTRDVKNATEQELKNLAQCYLSLIAKISKLEEGLYRIYNAQNTHTPTSLKIIAGHTIKEANEALERWEEKK